MTESSTERPEGQPEEGTKSRRLIKGAAIGIGSAALVAALLYANRSRAPKTEKPVATDRRIEPED